MLAVLSVVTEALNACGDDESLELPNRRGLRKIVNEAKSQMRKREEDVFQQLAPEEASMLDAALAPGFCSEEEAAADAPTPGLRREEESVADVEIKSLRANSLASADPGLRQDAIAADALTPGLRHEEESGADVERQRLRAQSPASADPGVRQEETAANVQVKRLRTKSPASVAAGVRFAAASASDVEGPAAPPLTPAQQLTLRGLSMWVQK